MVLERQVLGLALAEGFGFLAQFMRKYEPDRWGGWSQCSRLLVAASGGGIQRLPRTGRILKAMTVPSAWKETGPFHPLALRPPFHVERSW